jgi:hypothetical protein
MYAQSIGDHPEMRKLLARIADLEDELDKHILERSKGKWQVVQDAA